MSYFSSLRLLSLQRTSNLRKFMKTVLLILFVTSLVSCASKHTMMRGSVALKIDENKGIACLESDQVRPGMKLTLLNNDCNQNSTLGKDGIPNCRLVEAGVVEVTRIINDHYSEFKTLSDAKFSEGSIIQPSKI